MREGEVLRGSTHVVTKCQDSIAEDLGVQSRDFSELEGDRGGGEVDIMPKSTENYEYLMNEEYYAVNPEHLNDPLYSEEPTCIIIGDDAFDGSSKNSRTSKSSRTDGSAMSSDQCGPEPEKKQSQNKSRRPCFDFQNEVCIRGASCRFRHITVEVSSRERANGARGGQRGAKYEEAQQKKKNGRPRESIKELKHGNYFMGGSTFFSSPY